MLWRIIFWLAPHLAIEETQAIVCTLIGDGCCISHLLLCNKSSQIEQVTATSIDYLIASVCQKYGSNVAGWLCLRASQQMPIKLLTRLKPCQGSIGAESASNFIPVAAGGLSSSPRGPLPMWQLDALEWVIQEGLWECTHILFITWTNAGETFHKGGTTWGGNPWGPSSRLATTDASFFLQMSSNFTFMASA